MGSVVSFIFLGLLSIRRFSAGNDTFGKKWMHLDPLRGQQSREQQAVHKLPGRQNENLGPPQFIGFDSS